MIIKWFKLKPWVSWKVLKIAPTLNTLQGCHQSLRCAANCSSWQTITRTLLLFFSPHRHSRIQCLSQTTAFQNLTLMSSIYTYRQHNSRLFSYLGHLLEPATRSLEIKVYPITYFLFWDENTLQCLCSYKWESWWEPLGDAWAELSLEALMNERSHPVLVLWKKEKEESVPGTRRSVSVLSSWFLWESPETCFQESISNLWSCTSPDTDIFCVLRTLYQATSCIQCLFKNKCIVIISYQCLFCKYMQATVRFLKVNVSF